MIQTNHASRSKNNFGIKMVVATLAIIVADALVGPILPDSIYCALGAGIEMRTPAQRTANAWSAGNGCGAYDPRCAISWIETPASSVCIHSTLWDAIRKRTQGN